MINAKPRVVWGEVLRPDPAYVIRKLRYEAYPSYWVPALLSSELLGPDCNPVRVKLLGEELIAFRDSQGPPNRRTVRSPCLISALSSASR